MKRLLLTLCLSVFGVASLLAGNYPQRSDVLWVTVPDHADWLYRTGEQATIELQLYRYGMPLDGLRVDYELADDGLAADAKGSVTLKRGRASIPAGTMLKPGFRDVPALRRHRRQTVRTPHQGGLLARADRALHPDAG